MNTFFTRTVTGIVFVVLMVTSILLHPLSFAGITLVISLAVMWELSAMTGASSGTAYRAGVLGVGVPVILLMFLAASGILPGKYLLLEILPVMALILSSLFKKGGDRFSDSARALLAAMYGSVPFGLFFYASFDTAGPQTILPHTFGQFTPAVVLAFFALLWVNDSGAYITGVSVGKRKLFPAISPAKTWEGFFGGLLFTLIAAYGVYRVSALFTAPFWLLAGMIISVAATFGDLLESMIKRDAGVKDSGSFLPGHGGFMDRFDGVTFAFPMLWLLITFFG